MIQPDQGPAVCSGHSRHRRQGARQGLEAGGAGHGRRPSLAGTSRPGDHPGDRETGPGAGADRRDRVRARSGALCRHRAQASRPVTSAGHWPDLRRHSRPGSLLPAVRQSTPARKLYRPCPYDSGDGRRGQGISKAGNSLARYALIQAAWPWLRHQPNSAPTRWFHHRTEGQGKRVRCIMIVALARKLAIALWRYVEPGPIADAATLSAR